MEKRTIVFLFLLLLLLTGSCHVRDRKKEIVLDLGRPLSALERDSLEAWNLKRPEIRLVERNRLWQSEIVNLAVMGVAYMPDVFITDGLTGRFLARTDRVLSLTEFVTPKPGLAYLGEAWGIPAGRENVLVVVSDGDTVHTPGFISGTDLLCASLADSLGQAWLRHIVAGDRKSAFTDSCFVGVLSRLQDSLRSGNVVDEEDFIRGGCSSILIGGDALYRMLGRLREANPDRYSRLVFRAFRGGAVPRGYDKGFFINARLALDGPRFFDCLSLCQALSPDPGEPEDDTIRRLQDLLDTAPHAALPVLFISPGFWSTADYVISELVTGDKTLEEYAAILQDSYEQNYLNGEKR